jgi:hypothetical protein
MGETMRPRRSNPLACWNTLFREKNSPVRYSANRAMSMTPGGHTSWYLKRRENGMVGADLTTLGEALYATMADARRLPLNTFNRRVLMTRSSSCNSRKKPNRKDERASAASM